MEGHNRKEGSCPRSSLPIPRPNRRPPSCWIVFRQLTTVAAECLLAVARRPHRGPADAPAPPALELGRAPRSQSRFSPAGSSTTQPCRSASGLCWRAGGLASVSAAIVKTAWTPAGSSTGAPRSPSPRGRGSGSSASREPAVRRSRAGTLLLGHDERWRRVSVPFGGPGGGAHTLVVGATGSGKTVTQSRIAVAAIADGMGAIVIDPKGDAALREQLIQAARAGGRRFLEWTPEGPCVYNPLARGSETEVADKALGAERFTEPHYLRQAQRYLGHEVRALRLAGEQVTLAALVEYLDPSNLEELLRELPGRGRASLVRLPRLARSPPARRPRRGAGSPGGAVGVRRRSLAGAGDRKGPGGGPARRVPGSTRWCCSRCARTAGRCSARCSPPPSCRTCRPSSPPRRHAR